MTNTFALLLALPLALSAPVMAQDAPVATDEDTKIAFAMSMMCLESTGTLAVKAEAAGDTALYEKLAGEGEIWLGVSNEFGKELNRDAAAGFDDMVSGNLAEDRLLGTEAATKRQQQVYDACAQFLAGTK